MSKRPLNQFGACDWSSKFYAAVVAGDSKTTAMVEKWLKNMPQQPEGNTQ